MDINGAIKKGIQLNDYAAATSIFGIYPAL